DGALADEPQSARAFGFAPIAVGILDVRVRAVVSPDAGLARGEADLQLQRLDGLGVVTIDGERLDEVAPADLQSHHARAGRGDVRGEPQRPRRLDVGEDVHRLRLRLALDLRQRRGTRADVVRRLGPGQVHDVEAG